MKITKRLERDAVVIFAVLVVFAVCVSVVRADVGPRVKITMPIDSPQAVAGQPYDGVFEVHVRAPGVVDDFKLEGPGWTIHSFEKPAAGLMAARGILRVPFTATPTDPDAPIRLSMRYDRRRIARAVKIGPAAFALRGKDRIAVQVKDGAVGIQHQKSRRSEAKIDDPSARAGDLTFHFTGRIVYTRPGDTAGGDPIWFGATDEGVHGIWVEIMDDDGLTNDTVWSGYTDKDGYFDTGVFQWSDCDPICETEPDLFLRWECDTGIVNVQDAQDIFEPDYSWSTEYDLIYEDFTGTEIDFGTWKPAEQGVMAALHIHNSITRAHRFIDVYGGLDVPELDVLWPESGGGAGAYYDGDDEEIHITPSREWNEGTHVHEYGHHVVEIFAQNIEPEYCNGLNFCDGNTGTCAGEGPNCCSGIECEDPGHCRWCPETEHDAWNEGFPNWLSNITTRDFPVSYTFSDGTPYEALLQKRLENLDVCCQDDGTYSPWITQGYVEALMRDIEDSADRHGNTLQDDHDGDGICDCLELGYDEIFTVATVDDVITPEEFITAFIARYPQHMPGLYSTAYNVHPAFVSLFPVDTEPPGAVPYATSPSHPPIVGGTSPCIELKLGPVPDDVTGAWAFSVEWSTMPEGIEPDMTEEVQASCCLVSPPRILGHHYVSLRAKDRAGHWSSEWATFGPFTVTECNDNGILDVCEVACDASWYGDVGILACTPSATFCSDIYGSACQTEFDCQPNAVPDSCDIVDGESEDCDINLVPDECQEMKHWTGALDTAWELGGNWEEETIPVDSDIVCVPADSSGPGAVYREDDTVLRSLASYKYFTLNGASFPWPDLELMQNSFVLGDFQMSGNSVLKVNQRMYVDGHFYWHGGKIDGNGITEVNDGMSLTQGSVDLQRGDFKLTGGAGVSNGKLINMLSGATFMIGTRATYSYDGNSYIFYGSNGLVDIRGSLTRNSGDATATFFTPLENSGVVRTKTGKLYIGYGGTHTGQFIGDPGTTLSFGRDHTLTVASTLTAANVDFVSGTSVAHGTVDISDTILGSGAIWTFADDANIVSYGNHVNVNRGRVVFEAPTDQPIELQSVTITTTGESAGRIDFNTGQPVNVETFSMITGSLYGPSPINVSGTFSWTNGALFSGGAITGNGLVVINATSSSRTISRVLNIADQAAVYAGFTMSGGASVNILDSAVFDMQFNSGTIGSRTINNDGTVLRSSGTGEIRISAAMNNSGLIHNQSGTLNLAGGGTYTGDVIADPGTILKISGTGHNFESSSTMTTPTLELAAGNSSFHGSVEITDTLICDSASWTFPSDANIIDYGDHLSVVRSSLHFESPTDRAVHFDTVQIGPNFNSSNVHFDTGQPFNVDTFVLNDKGSIDGSSPINIAVQFTWSNGNIYSGGPIRCDGTTTVNATSSARTLRRPLNNYGTMTIRGPFTLGGSVPINNMPGAVIDLQYENSSMGLTGVINNEGTMIKSTSAGTAGLPNVLNSGTVDIQVGAISFHTTYVGFTQTAGETILHDTSIEMIANNKAFELQGGLLMGNGTVIGEVNNSGGTVAPGLSVGEIEVDDYTQGANGVLELEIGGANVGEYDVLTVTNTATLAGELVVTDINEFVPQAGDTFVILTAATVVGTFDTVTAPDHYEVVYSPTAVTLQLTGPSPDLNGDGLFDLKDYGFFQSCYSGSGQPPSPSCAEGVNADLDEDGDIDHDDFRLLFAAITQ